MKLAKPKMYEDTGRKKTQLLNCDLTIILEITIIPEYNCTGNFLMIWICENTILPKFLESLYQDKVPAIKINICQQDKVKATEIGVFEITATVCDTIATKK